MIRRKYVLLFTFSDNRQMEMLCRNVELIKVELRELRQLVENAVIIDGKKQQGCELTDVEICFPNKPFKKYKKLIEFDNALEINGTKRNQMVSF